MITISALLLFAQADGGDGQPSPMKAFELPLLMLGFFMIFYLFVLRPMGRRQERDRVALLHTLKKNDKVLTHAGIYATVVSISDTEDEVVLKVDDNARLRVVKASIARNLTNEEAARAEREKQKAAK